VPSLAAARFSLWVLAALGLVNDLVFLTRNNPEWKVYLGRSPPLEKLVNCLYNNLYLGHFSISGIILDFLTRLFVSVSTALDQLISFIQLPLSQLALATPQAEAMTVSVQAVLEHIGVIMRQVFGRGKE